MKRSTLAALAVVAAAAMFWGGYAAATAQNQYETPSTIVHVVTIKFKPEASEADRQRVLDGVKEMAGQIEGIRRVWVKATRVQPREYHAAFAIEFADREAADRYATHPAHDAWVEFYLPLREESRSQQITN